jgi:cytoplasmic iron level regulating protein YaaA (DUF328/UPF0246 family)
MYAVISPAKKLDFDHEVPVKKSTKPRYQKQAADLIKILRKCSKSEVSSLMKLSDSLTELNVKRYSDFDLNADSHTGKQAIFCFAGDTYKGLEPYELDRKTIEYAQDHLGILSGLYGLIRPLDSIQPYRLEMGTKLKCGDSKNLYQYWGDLITKELNKKLKDEKFLVNLASQEYFGVVQADQLKGEVVTPVFKENKNGNLKVVGLYAKKARGMMARYILKNRIENIEGLKDFDLEGYKFNKELSSTHELVFSR